MPIMLFLFVLRSAVCNTRTWPRVLSTKRQQPPHPKWQQKRTYHAILKPKTMRLIHGVSMHLRWCVCMRARSHRSRCINCSPYIQIVNCLFRCIWFLNWLVNLLTYNRNIRDIYFKAIGQSMQPNHTLIAFAAKLHRLQLDQRLYIQQSTDTDEREREPKIAKQCLETRTRRTISNTESKLPKMVLSAHSLARSSSSGSRRIWRIRNAILLIVHTPNSMKMHRLLLMRLGENPFE